MAKPKKGLTKRAKEIVKERRAKRGPLGAMAGGRSMAPLSKAQLRELEAAEKAGPGWLRQEIEDAHDRKFFAREPEHTEKGWTKAKRNPGKAVRHPESRRGLVKAGAAGFKAGKKLSKKGTESRRGSKD